MSKVILFSILLLGQAASAAERPQYNINFGPFVGGGTMTNNHTVRHASGYSVAFTSRLVQLGKIHLGPRVEFDQAFTNSKRQINDRKQVYTYDNRLIGAGLQLEVPVGSAKTLVQSLSFATLIGRGFSKLEMDESNNEFFRHNQLGGIKGNYLSSELGAFIPLKDEFGINLAFLSAIYKADQSQISGAADTSDGEQFNLVEAVGSEDELVEETVTIKFTAAKLSLILGF